MPRKIKIGTSRRLGRDNGEKKTETNDQSLVSMEDEGINVMANAALRKTEPISQDFVQLIASQSENPELDTTKTKRKLGSTRRVRERQDVNELWLEEACGNKIEVFNDAAPSEAVNSELHQNASLSIEPYSHREPAEKHFPSSLKETKSNPPYLQILLDKNTAQSSNSADLAHSANTHAIVDSDRTTVKEEEQKMEHHWQRLQEDMLYESPIKLEKEESNMIKAESPVDRGYESSLKYDTLTQEHLDQSDCSLLGKFTLSDHTENTVSLSQIPSELLHQSEDVLRFCHQVTGPCDENEILHLTDDFTDETQSMVNLEDIDADFNKQADLTFDEPIILNPDDIYLSGQVSQEPMNQKHTECTFADLSDTRNTSTNQTREKPTERNELYGNEKEERHEGFLVEDMSPHYMKRPHGQKEDIDPFSQISQAEISGRIQDSGTGYFASKVASLQTLQTDSYLCHQETTTAEPQPVAGRRKMGSTRRPCRDFIVGENTEDWDKEEHIDGENNRNVMVGEGEVCQGEDRDTKVELSDGENGDKIIGEDVLTRSVTEGFDYSGNVSENQFNIFHEHDSKTSLIRDIRQPEDVLLAGADDAVLQCIYEFTDSSQTSSQDADVPAPSQSDDRLNLNVIVSDGQHNPAPNEDTLPQLREILSYSQFPPLLGRAEENVNLEPNGTKRKSKMGSTRGNPKSWHDEEHTREGDKQDTTVPEVKDSVNIDTTPSIENIDLMEYTETIREVERGGQLRGGTDTEDKDLEVIDLHQSNSKITSEEGNDNTLPKQHVSEFNNEDPIRSKKNEILKERERQDIFHGHNEETTTTEVESQSNETQATTCADKDVEYDDAVEVTMDNALMTETWTNKEEIEDPTNYPFTVEERVKQSVDPLKLKKVAKILTVSHEDTHEEAIPISDACTENISYQLDEAKILPINVHDVHVSEQSLDVNVADNYLSQTENAKDSSSQKLPVDSSLCNEETPCMNSKAAKKKRKMGSTRRPCRDLIVGENTEDWEKKEHIDGENNKDVLVGEGEVCHGEDRDTKVELGDGENGDKSIGADILTRSVTEENVSENQFKVFQSESKASPIGDITQPEDVLLTGGVNAAQYMYEFPDSRQTLSQYADRAMSFQSDDKPSTYSIVSDGQHNPTPYEKKHHQLTENLSSSQFPELLERAKEEVNVELNTSRRRKKVGSTRANPKSRHEEEHTGEGEKEGATVPKTIPEVENIVKTGTTLRTENIEFRESAETLTEEEREGQLRLVSDAKDKGLNVRELHKTDDTIYKEIEDSPHDLYTAQEKIKPLEDTMMVEDPHHVLESDIVNYQCSQSKDVETTPRESSHRLLSDSSLCHVGSPPTINTGKKRKMGSTRKNLHGTHEEIHYNRKLKGDLTEPEDGSIGEQYKERENDKATERKFCHSTSIQEQEQTKNDSLEIVGMADNSQSKNDFGSFKKPSGVSVQLGQFEDMLSHKPAGDEDLSPSHSECRANIKDPIQDLNIDPKATGKRTKNVSSLSNSREKQDEYLRQEKQEEDTKVKELATNDDHVVQNSDPLNKSHQLEDFSNANNDVENPQGKRKKMGSRRHGHGEFNNGNNRNEHWPGSTESNNDDMLHLDNQTEDKGTEKVVTLDFEGNKTLLCRDGPIIRQEVGSADCSGKTLPEQLEPTPYVGAGNTRSSAEQVEKTCEGEEVKKRIQTRQHQDTSTNRVPGQSRYNIVMVGNSNVGKTSFLKQFRSGEFCSNICASIGIDTCTQSVIVDGKAVMLQLWDTAGQERFRSITRQVFHKAQAFLLMYDITSSQSFSDVRYWVTSIQDNAIDEVIIILLGNKNDCAKRQVEPHEAESLAKEYNIYFMECSAATGDNVQQSMEIVARLMKQKVDEAEEGSMVLHKEPPVKKSGSCC
ncbi:uncharacterized protein LOC124470614 isoform X2 [Hypomesus transpacificus]|uniref:uncharacterized protein LOC124470614 isoform X2 n=1 Tax=Hypomesus transpacificus TaxID=137520 RepID=UPI001F082073|nr:uncharacterized protein LOC124470614 isoform X2 [Hypomesus transpacificus]